MTSLGYAQDKSRTKTTTDMISLSTCVKNFLRTALCVPDKWQMSDNSVTYPGHYPDKEDLVWSLIYAYITICTSKHKIGHVIYPGDPPLGLSKNACDLYPPLFSPPNFYTEAYLFYRDCVSGMSRPVREQVK